VCQYLAKPRRERELESEELDDTPSVRELYSIIMTLAAKYNALEAKLSQMTPNTDKLSLIAWLNTTPPPASMYTAWVNALNPTPADLAVLFENDYVRGVSQFIQKQLLEQPVMRAFKTKENTLYIYDEKWIVCENDTFLKLMQLLDKQFMREFICWQNQHKSKMLTDDSFSDLYARHLKKITGGNFTREQLYSRIKRELYMNICQPFEQPFEKG
jgi:hypothetical protein